ncbi:MAG: carboxylesterase family protein, partial [Oscillospiraceae bacterium]|nr:carboxylesterase family protein [Oscillospiraceae bacterium]
MKQLFSILCAGAAVAAVAVGAALAAGCASAPSDPLIVRTKAGLVKGIEEEGTLAFKGIPYATVERFMPPKPVAKWDTVMVCDHFGPQVMQGNGRREMPESVMSEKNSCVLNVWTTDIKASKP